MTTTELTTNEAIVSDARTGEGATGSAGVAGAGSVNGSGSTVGTDGTSTPGGAPTATTSGGPENAFAITSFVLGIASIVSGWTFVAPIIGLVFGVLALRRKTTERTLALWGVWLNVAMLALSALLVLGMLLFAGIALIAGAPFIEAATLASM